MIICQMIDVIGVLTIIIETFSNFQMLPPLPTFYYYDSLNSLYTGTSKNYKLFLYHKLSIILYLNFYLYK